MQIISVSRLLFYQEIVEIMQLGTSRSVVMFRFSGNWRTLENIVVYKIDFYHQLYYCIVLHNE